MNEAGFASQFFCITENIQDVTSSQGERDESRQGQCHPGSGEEGSLQPTQLPQQPRPEDPTWREAQEAEALP